MNKFNCAMGLLVVNIFACATVELPNEEVNSGFGGMSVGLATGGTGLGPRTYKCLNHCGEAVGTPPNQCFCDAACVTLGDCCDDYQPLCGDQSCEDWCDMQAPAGCWCDDACGGLGDCCPFKVFWCGV